MVSNQRIEDRDFCDRPMTINELQDCLTRVFFAVRDLKQMARNAHLSSAEDARKCAAHLDAWVQKTSQTISQDS